jgi:hypothetical protein
MPNQPSIRETAFICPHCSAYTSQHWYSLFAASNADKAPVVPTDKDLQEILDILPPEQHFEMKEWFNRIHSGFVFLSETGTARLDNSVSNLHLSKCYNCSKIAVWVYDRLLFPSVKAGVLPNPDLPDNILRDFEEARDIVNQSPRGSAALLRLCVQKLCIHLGEKGKSIDADIASLVTKGLNPLVHKSLDIVRVIGNESVHPGELDLNDDRDTALRLFDLVNSIADQMISHPKAVEEMYQKLPENKRKSIEQRDKKSPQP